MAISYNSNTILITGTAGFIGFHVANLMLDNNWKVIGVDGMTEYYDISLKKARHKILQENKNFKSYETMLEDEIALCNIFEENKPSIIIHLAAQAGVRYSIENPKSYMNSNIIGTFNILEMSKIHSIRHLLIASTSSVYGSNKQMPFHENQKTNSQMSFYAATKKSNECMAHSYSHIYNIPTTIFRFFTVYGPWGRPDMALFKFTKAIFDDKEIDVFNFGKMTRDFTYISDIAEAIKLLVSKIPEEKSKRKSNYKFDSISDVAPFRIVNIGNSKPVTLIEYIETLEKEIGKKAKKNLMKLQIGDVPDTSSDITLLKELTGFIPKIHVTEGIKNFIKWYKSYYLKG